MKRLFALMAILLIATIGCKTTPLPTPTRIAEKPTIAPPPTVTRVPKKPTIAPSLTPTRPPEKPTTAPPSASPPTRQNLCGDGVCGPAEKTDPNLCPADCGVTTPPPASTEPLPPASPTPAVNDESLPDELRFIPDAGIRIKNAAQPAPVVADDGSIYLFYVEKGGLPNEPSSSAVAYSADGLTFTETGLDPKSVLVTNPHALQLPDGTWRLYLLNSNTGEMTSNSSTDGIHFTPDDGIRYTAPAEHLPIGIRDFYVNPAGDVILLYIAPLEKPDHHIRRAVSTDGGDTFKFHSDNVLGDRGGGDQHTFVDQKFVELPDGSARLIVMMQGQVPIPGQRACCNIYSFTTADGYSFSQDPGIRLQTDDFTELSVWSLNDPWVIRLPNGRYRMYVAALVMDEADDDPYWAILSATTPLPE